VQIFNIGNQVVRSHAEGANTNIAPMQSLEQRKTMLSLPPWFKDLVKKSNIAPDIDGWNNYAIARKDGTATDKVSKLQLLSLI
jgi:hypothetical protein